MLIFNASHRQSAWTWEPLLRNSAACVREVIIPEGGILLQPKGTFSAFIPSDIDAYPYLDQYEQTDPVVIPLRDDEPPFIIYPNETAPSWSGALTPLTPVVFDSGAAITGYHLDGDRVYLSWSLSKSHSEYDYQYYVHFYDASGSRVSQRDASFYTGRYWCAGDSLVTWIDETIPAAAQVMRLGMYRLDDGAIIGSSVIDGSGSASPWYDVSLPASDGT